MDDPILSKAFTELASHYEETMNRELEAFWAMSYRELADQLFHAACIQEGDRILDIATGTAFLLRHIAHETEAAVHIVGLDMIPAMLRHAREKAEVAHSPFPVHLVCASAMAMPLAAGSFDVVICALGTHHMDVPRLLDEAKHVLKGEGRLVIIEAGISPFWRSIWGHIFVQVLLICQGLALQSPRSRAEMEALGNMHTADEWRAVLPARGFAQVQVAESRARYPWYPSTLTIKAVVSRT